MHGFEKKAHAPESSRRATDCLSDANETLAGRGSGTIPYMVEEMSVPKVGAMLMPVILVLGGKTIVKAKRGLDPKFADVFVKRFEATLTKTSIDALSSASRR